MATRRGFLAALAALLPAAIAARVLPVANGLPAYDLGAVAKPLFPDIPRVSVDWASGGDRTVIVGVRKMADGGKMIVEWLDEYDPPAARIVPAMLPEQPSWLALRNSRW